MKGAGDFSIGSRVWPGVSKLLEEMGEVGQVLGKLVGAGGEIHHWDGTNLKERLEDELGDALAAIIFVVRHCGLNVERITHRREIKLATFEDWHLNQVPLPRREVTITLYTVPLPSSGFIGPDCITSEDGEAVHSYLAASLAEGAAVTLNFEGVEVCSAPFFNALLGDLMKNQSVEEFQERVQVRGMDPNMKAVFHRAVHSSWEYFHDDQVRTVVDGTVA